MRAKTAIFGLLIFLIAAASPTTAPSNDLGPKVVEFCQAHLGQQVGNGQCSSLAYAALGNAGAKRRGKDSPEKGDYTWGQLALIVQMPDGDKQSDGASKTVQFDNGKPSDLRAGDIVQFRETKFVHHNGNRTSSWSFGHHTAVVSAVDDDGKTVHLYQQNISGKLFVTEATIHLDDLTKGWARFYHPVPKNGEAEQPDPKD
jgi:hypothetical protein